MPSSSCRGYPVHPPQELCCRCSGLPLHLGWCLLCVSLFSNRTRCSNENSSWLWQGVYLTWGLTPCLFSYKTASSKATGFKDFEFQAKCDAYPNFKGIYTTWFSDLWWQFMRVISKGYVILHNIGVGFELMLLIWFTILAKVDGFEKFKIATCSA